MAPINVLIPAEQP